MKPCGPLCDDTVCFECAAESEAVAWAAGLFEGEGSFSTTFSNNVPGGKRWDYVRLSLCSTDEDVVRRYHAVAGCGSVSGPYQYTGNRKPYWTWAAQGKHAEHWLDKMLPFLGMRRTTRAGEIRRVVHG